MDILNSGNVQSQNTPLASINYIFIYTTDEMDIAERTGVDSEFRF